MLWPKTRKIQSVFRGLFNSTYILSNMMKVFIVLEQGLVESFNLHRRPFVALVVLIAEERIVGRQIWTGLHEFQHCFLLKGKFRSSSVTTRRSTYMYVATTHLQEVDGILLVSASARDCSAAREIQVHVNCTYSILTHTCWNRHMVAQTTSHEY